MAELKKAAPVTTAGRDRLPGRALSRRAAGDRSRRSTRCSAPARCRRSWRALERRRSRRSAAAWSSSPHRSFHRAVCARTATSRSARATELPTYIYDADTPRILATPRHYAYVKVAEGCDYKCAFCIIPAAARALSQPPGRRRSSREARRLASARRQGAPPHQPGHDLLRHRPGRARRARPPAARAERGRRPRVDPAALPLPDDHRRRDARRDGRVREGRASTSTCRCSTRRMPC